MRRTSYINAIIQLADRVDYPTIHQDVPYRTFRRLSGPMSFGGKALPEYLNLLSGLYEIEKEINKTCTLKYFEEQLIQFFESDFISKNVIDDLKSKCFIETLLATRVQTFHVFRDIFGVALKEPLKPCKLGPYTLYSIQCQSESLRSRIDLMPESVWIGQMPKYLIEVTVKARHSEKARELADERFVNFENIVSYMIGPTEHNCEVGILNYRGLKSNRAYVSAEDGSTSTAVWNNGSLDPVFIDDPFFTRTESGYDKIWTMFFQDTPTTLHKKVQMAIEWLGQSINDDASGMAFLKAAMALEVLFVLKQDTIISASIQSQIAENVASLVETTSETRVELESRMKMLYGIRSAIVHHGKNEVDPKKLIELQLYAKKAIIRLITSKELSDYDSIEKVHKRLREMRYSFPPL